MLNFPSLLVPSAHRRRFFAAGRRPALTPRAFGAAAVLATLGLACSENVDAVGPGGTAGAPGGSANVSGSSAQAGAGGGSGGGGTSTAGGTASTGGGGLSTGGAATGGGGLSTGGGGTLGGGGATVGGAATGGATSGGGAGAGGMGGSAGAGGSGGVMPSAGCGKTRTLQDGNRSVQSGGAQRTYALRTPTNYDNMHPYRLMLGFHGATNSSKDVAPSYFGLWDLAEGSTIFVAPDAVGGIWNATSDATMVKDLLKQLEDDLCIDLSRVELEGFSQGGAMVWTLACAMPGTFRVAVVHSGGGLPMPSTCKPIPFFSALGNDGSGQGMSSDFFAKTNGCTVETLPLPPAGGHVCTDYKGCTAGFPTRYCDYDGPHTPAHADSGSSKSWVPQEVWNFIKQF